MATDPSHPTASGVRLGLALALLAALFGVAAVVHAEPPRWRLEAGSVATAPGRVAEVGITLRTGGAPVAAIAFVVVYDASRLVLDADPAAGSKVEVGVPGEFATSSWVGLEPGVIGIAVYDPTPPVGLLPDGEIARLRFRARADASGFAPVRIDPVRPIPASDPLGRGIPGEISDAGGVAIAAARPALTLSHSILYFGSVPLGSSSAQRLIASNSGTAPLEIRSAALEGGGWFRLTAAPRQTLAPGESTAIEVHFDAAARGEHTATLRIESDGAGHATVLLLASATAGEFYFDRRVVVPAVARLDGAEGSRWLSQLHLHNAGANEARARLTLIPNGDLPPAGPVEVPLAAGTSRSWSDALGELFGGIEGSGALLLECSSGELVIRSATYNRREDGARIAQSVPAIEIPRLFHTGETAFLIGLESNAERRTNLTVTNFGEEPAHLVLEALDPSGEVLARRDVLLDPRRIESGIDLLTGLDRAGGLTVRVRAATPNATFFAYASTVDQRSGAPMFQSAR